MTSRSRRKPLITAPTQTTTATNAGDLCGGYLRRWMLAGAISLGLAGISAPGGEAFAQQSGARAARANWAPKRTTQQPTAAKATPRVTPKSKAPATNGQRAAKGSSQSAPQKWSPKRKQVSVLTRPVAQPTLAPVPNAASVQPVAQPQATAPQSYTELDAERWDGAGTLANTSGELQWTRPQLPVDSNRTDKVAQPVRTVARSGHTASQNAVQQPTRLHAANMEMPRIARRRAAATPQLQHPVRQVSAEADVPADGKLVPVGESLEQDFASLLRQTPQSDAPHAPAPEDVFATTRSRLARDLFKDQTPSARERIRRVARLQAEQAARQRNQPTLPSPESRSIPEIRQVQAESRFDAADLLDDLTDPSDAATEQPTLEQPAFDAPAPATETPRFDIGEPVVEQPAADRFAPTVDPTEPAAEPQFEQLTPPTQPTPAAEPATRGGSELSRSLIDELNEFEASPSDDAETLPSPGDLNVAPPNPMSLDGETEDDAQSGDDSDDDQEPVVGELTVTNGRDCGKAGEACRKDFSYLRRRERTDMSLDITPSIEPREFDMARVEEIRVKRLADAPTRTWRGPDGNVIADGNLEDYRDGKVYIRTRNGSIRTVQPHRLGNDEWCFVTSWWGLPAECRFEDEKFVMRDFRMTTFTWTAPNTCHKPLYFEQVGLERYGHSSGPVAQPVISAAHFFGDVVMLPYHVGLNPPNECLYTLGHYRPGNCAPWLLPGFPYSSRGFKWEGLALGAAIALLP